MRWPKVALGDIAQIVGGSTPCRDNPEFWGLGYYWATPTDLPMPGEGILNLDATSQTITEEGLRSCSTNLLPVGAVLYSTRATIGKLAIANVPVATNQGFNNFIVSDAIFNRFLAYSLQYFTPEISLLAGSTTFKEVSRSSLRSFKIPLPPMREQRRIVEILDNADRLRRLRREADAKAARILPALFLKMFGDPATNPMGWPILRFDEIADARLGKMLDSKRQTGEHCRPYLRNQNVQWDYFKLDDVLDMDFLPHERAEFELRVGDLLVCEGGEIGRAAIWDGQISECYFQKALHRVRPHLGKATPEFLLYWLWAMARCQSLMSLNSKATIPHLTGVQLAALRIICPPFQNQQDFARLVSNYRRSELRRQEAARGIEALFQILLQRAFSGQLTAKWREAHGKELLAEMEQQARLLNLPLQKELELAA